jgi:L-amino acid N-acyltransferase YncA
MDIREATSEDWPEIWAIMRPILAEGATFAWDEHTSEDDARAAWCHQPPGRTLVAVDDNGTIAGTAESHPNHGGPGAHVANAGFMVHPGRFGQGVGRALAEQVVDQARADGYRAMQFNAVVESNTRAVALWQSLGFDILATVPEGFRHPVHGYVGLHIMFRRL